ncbi:MAG TPA: sulfotransferase, partial [Thermoplasmatales archaeon]|nr:sulfotransferase [Thermoplasmatales archaeon]
VYQYYLKKVTLYFHGKRLVLKNPANTGRIKLLLTMFPDAKFIHIYRNPYHVFLSMKRDIDAEMSLYCVQKPEEEEVLEKAMVELYNRMFEKYFEEKKLIPEGHLVEVKYEDFITNPLREIKRIYQELGLPNFEESEDEFKQYILSQSKIRTHRYSIDEELKKKIYSYFKLTIDQWGYDV